MPDPSMRHGVPGSLTVTKRSVASQDVPADSLNDEGTKRQAWLREMERAQLADWFVSTSRESFRHEFPVKNSARLEPLRAPVAFSPERGFPYAIAGESVEHSDVLAPAKNRERASEKSDTGSVLHTDDVNEFWEQSAFSDIPETLGEHRATAVPLPGAGFPREIERVSLAAGSAAVQELPGLSARPHLISPELARFVSPPVMFRMESVGSQLVEDIPNMRVALRETEAVDGTFLPNVATQRSTATRLHTQWTSEGLNLWIGMDGTARQVELQAQAIVTTLQRTLKFQGQRLSRVVCNGTVVFDDKVSEFGNRHLTDFSSFWKQEAHVRMSVDISLSISQSSKET
jgi:hypothetical protein